MNRGQLWPFAKGSEENLLWATAVFIGATIVNRLLSNTITRVIWLAATSVWLIVLYFFRDPDRDTLGEPGLVLCPADGEVVSIVTEEESTYFKRPMTRISIFLSLLDVHVQRNPTDGEVLFVDHRPGQYLQAFRPEASEVNEYIAMGVRTPEHGDIIVKQIAGIMARRCVNHQQAGDQLAAGDRFGMIRFSSRVDLFLPPDAVVLAQVGEKVAAGLSPMARLR